MTAVQHKKTSTDRPTTGILASDTTTQPSAILGVDFYRCPIFRIQISNVVMVVDNKAVSCNGFPCSQPNK